MKRRLLLQAGQAMLAASPFALHSVSFASTWPTGTIRMVVPFPAGGPLDALARAFGDRMTSRGAQAVVIDNKPGAGGAIGVKAAAGAAPDGRTLLITGDTVFTVNPHVMTDGDPLIHKKFKPLALIGSSPLILVARPGFPAKTLQDIQAEAAAKPINFGSGGIGSPGHLGYEQLSSVTGVKGVHVPYKGASPLMTALMSGEVDAALVSTGAAAPLISGNKIMPLAVLGERRSTLLPNVPTGQEFGIQGGEVTFAYMVLAPAAIDAPLAAFYSAHLREILATPELTKVMGLLDLTPLMGSGADAERWIEIESERWRRVAMAAGMAQK